MSARLGRSAGQHRWGDVANGVQFSHVSIRWLLTSMHESDLRSSLSMIGAQCRLSPVFVLIQARVAMLVAGGAAAIASGAFLALRAPLQNVMQLTPAVREYAQPYWLLRAACVPLQLWVSGMSGILQGYSRVALNAALFVGTLRRAIITAAQRHAPQSAHYTDNQSTFSLDFRLYVPERYPGILQACTYFNSVCRASMSGDHSIRARAQQRGSIWHARRSRAGLCHSDVQCTRSARPHIGCGGPAACWCQQGVQPVERPERRRARSGCDRAALAAGVPG